MYIGNQHNIQLPPGLEPIITELPSKYLNHYPISSALQNAAVYCHNLSTEWCVCDAGKQNRRSTDIQLLEAWEEEKRKMLTRKPTCQRRSCPGGLSTSTHRLQRKHPLVVYSVRQMSSLALQCLPVFMRQGRRKGKGQRVVKVLNLRSETSFSTRRCCLLISNWSVSSWVKT